MYLIGYDIGSSSVKAALVDAESGKTLVRTQYPDREMDMQAPRAGWAEQHPDQWWEGIVQATQRLLKSHSFNPQSVKAIGISYQMHGLVLVDAADQVLRPSIIWCDGRAVDIGAAAFERIGQQKALAHLLNSPGNFTASKLRWVQENEPELYRRIKHFMLPGDYIALKMTGETCSTISGLSEGIFWDFLEQKPADLVFQDYGIDPALMPALQPTFGIQGALRAEAAAELGLVAGIPVAYRAGDQPNNALSLNVLDPGEVAATGGTSGVVYAITDQAVYDPLSRVNGFAHVNYTLEHPSIGVLMCINGAGITYSWLRQNMGAAGVSYPELEERAAQVPIGADGLSILPFGNSAERILNNVDLGAQIQGLNFNRHGQAHLIRAGLEGIAFAFVYGMSILQEMGLDLKVMRVGNDNLFQSRIFAETIATLCNSHIEMLDTTGAVGAAKGAGFGAGVYSSLREALGSTPKVGAYEPLSNADAHTAAYSVWLNQLHKLSNK
ncbi:xylulokinase [Haliscomenobacter hydrossis]|uniref:Xylulokinase n=1 Tax=Haliscomenobacter hydrossis (strain ATCC 27775 / DSM 1100 / LMG 10767 / O) TaxID=760192 RepID=F4KTC1_HALH1|nr:FGGY family carbohydrate kinase [Haliscomenobacter hydrossis]AEE51178.1 Xylulokinase [Haliscomenobacter hydrossis DSM 1100]